MNSTTDPAVDAYIDASDRWPAEMRRLRSALLDCGLDEQIKWGNLVFAHQGLAILVRAEDHRVLLGFWRGKRLTALEPRIKPSGKYELGNIVLFEGDSIAPEQVARLAREAARLNDELGDPTARS